MNRTILLVILFLVLGAGAWYALREKKKTGTLTAWDMDFAIKDPNEIAKVFLADRKGRTVTLERREGYWTYNGSERVRPTAIENLLRVMSKLNVQYVPTQAAEVNMIKSLAAEGIKVEAYDRDGEKIKVYYVGGVTADERGTYMIMEGSENPYVVHLPSMIGQVRIYYMLNEDDWLDRAVFREKPNEIAALSIEYPQQKSESFRLEKTGEAQYDVKPYFSTQRVNPRPPRAGLVEAYLAQFESLVAENFETDNPERDSITALVPFAVVTLKRDNGEQKEVRFWPANIQMDYAINKAFVTHYFTEIDRQSFVLTQPRVFGPVFRGYDSFFEAGKEIRN
jgi:hypothetical protein